MEYKSMPYPIIDSHCHLDFKDFEGELDASAFDAFEIDLDQIAEIKF